MSTADMKFMEWFYHEVYAEPNHNRNGWMKQYADMTQHDCRDWWMREAYKAGYNQRKQDEIAELDLWMDELTKDFDEQT